LTLWGNIIAGIVAALFWWIATDIASLVVNGATGYWTWLAGTFGYPDIRYTFFMIDVTKALSIVLVITILLEILDVFIVYRKIDTFAAETLRGIGAKVASVPCSTRLNHRLRISHCFSFDFRSC